MRTKPDDIPFCWTRPEVIASAKPVLDERILKDLYRYIRNRYIIHLRKDVLHQNPPWIKDPILQTYRFTNIRREHDKETKWLIDNIVQCPGLSYEDKMINIVLFRLFNKHETAELLGMPIPFYEDDPKAWDPEPYRHLFTDALKEDPERGFFTKAFMVSGMKRTMKRYVPAEVQDSYEMRIMYFIKHLLQIGYVDRIKLAEDQREAYDVINSVEGLGYFLSYQVFVDMTYMEEFPFSENEFVVAGPGCKSGLSYLFTDKGKMTYEECLFWVRDNIEQAFEEKLGLSLNPKELFWDLPVYDRCLNVMSLENIFCELSKYIKVRAHQGRPRKKYTYMEVHNESSRLS